MVEFGIDGRMMRALAPCMDSYGSGDAKLYEWPNNVLSVKTVVFEDGTFAREGTSIERDVDNAELVRCGKLAAEIQAFVAGVTVRMKSEADSHWAPFFQVASVGAAVPQALDVARVRAMFGDTIMPLAQIVVEPLEEAGTWWQAVMESGDPATTAWRKLVAFVAAHPALHGAVFAQIGFGDYGDSPQPQGEPPPGYAMAGSCLPRLACAFTDKGSVVGVLGHVVWT